MKELTPVEAKNLLDNDPEAVLIDVRSEIEYMFVGHPVGAFHVPWVEGPDWEINPHFVAQVKMVANSERQVVLICRSGVRSAEAGHLLEKSGWQAVFNVLHGFEGDLDPSHHRSSVNGWRHEGLPWVQT